MDTRWTSTTKLVVLVAVLIVTAWAVIQLGQVVAPLLVAFILAYLLKPPTDWIMRRTGWPRGMAITLLFLILLLVLILAPVLATPSVVALVSSINVDVGSLATVLANIGAEGLQIGPIAIDTADLSQRFVQTLQDLVTPFATGAFQIISGIANSLLWTIFVFVVTFWLLKDSYKLESWFLSLIPARYRDETDQLLDELGNIWGNFFRGELLLGLTVGALVGISMWVLGIRSPLLLGIISGILEFIPTIGPVLALIPALLLAWFGGSSWLPLSNLAMTIIVAIVYTFIFQIDQIYLLPRIMGRRVNLHPGIVFVGTVVAASQIGVLGVLIAAPVIASFRLFGSYGYRKLLDLEPAVLVSETELVPVEPRELTRGRPIAGVLFDMDGTLVDSDDTTVEHLAARLGRVQRLFPNGDARPFIRHLLLLAEGPLNWFITQLDRFNLDDEGFRLQSWMQAMRGQRRPEEMRLIPGVAETLRQLQQRYKLAVVTTRSRATTQHALASNGLDDVFAVIITRDDVRRLKPHPEPVLLAIRQLGLQADQCVMVGDTPVDILAARAAGTRAVGVLCGFGQRRELQDADIVLDSTTNLTAWL